MPVGTHSGPQNGTTQSPVAASLRISDGIPRFICPHDIPVPRLRDCVLIRRFSISWPRPSFFQSLIDMAGGTAAGSNALSTSRRKALAGESGWVGPRLKSLSQ